jgi:hypothetical protein
MCTGKRHIGAFRRHKSGRTPRVGEEKLSNDSEPLILEKPKNLGHFWVLLRKNPKPKT